MKSKRLLSLLLVIALLTGCLAGCGDKQETSEKGDTENTEAFSAKFAYQASYTPLSTPDGEPLSHAYSVCVIGDRIYYSASYVDGMTQAVDEITGEPIIDETTGEPVEYENYVNGIFVYDLATKQVSRMDSYVPAEVPEGMKGGSNVSQLFGGADGSLWIYEELYTYSFDLPDDFNPDTMNAYDYYVPGENSQILTQYSADGTKLNTRTLNLGDTYISRIYALSDGRILGYDWENIYLIDETGAVTDTITAENVRGDLSYLGNDRFVVVAYDEETQQQKLMELDLTQKTFVDNSSIPANVYNLYPGFGEYDYLYQINDTIFGMVKGAAAGEKLFSWMDCDVNSNNVENFYILDDGRIIALENDYSASDSRINLIVMEQVDPAVLSQKQVLTLGCLSMDWDLRTDIVQFNRAHDDIRIVVKDYSEYITDGDYEAALASAVQKLTTEILSGDAPDILCTDGLPVAQYAAKGILTDLWPLIDSDPDLSRDDLMTHFFDALSIDGKLYQVTDSFAIQTAATYQEIANGRTSWTLDEMLEALDALGDGAAIFGETDTSGNMLETLTCFNLDNFMDWESGTCSFDSQEFLDILNFAAKFPKEFDYNSYDWETADSPYTRMKNGKQLMVEANLYSFDEVQFTAALLDNKASYIGFPTESGSGSSFSCNGGLAISSTCKNVDAAWSLVRTLLLQENQEEENMYRFPTNKHAFETYKTKAMTAEYTTDPETGAQVEVSTGGIGYNDFMMELYAVKQEDYDAFMSVYENCNSVSTSNNEVMELINGHAAAFFDGQKTAEETAKLIQDSVSLYMMEQG